MHIQIRRPWNGGWLAALEDGEIYWAAEGENATRYHMFENAQEAAAEHGGILVLIDGHGKEADLPANLA